VACKRPSGAEKAARQTSTLNSRRSTGKDSQQRPASAAKQPPEQRGDNGNIKSADVKPKWMWFFLLTGIYFEAENDVSKESDEK
jgi:hypothetical protein